MAFTHISHVYKQGASLYTTYFFRAAKDRYAATLKRWQKIKQFASIKRRAWERRYRISMASVVIMPHILLLEKGKLGILVTHDMLKS